MNNDIIIIICRFYRLGSCLSEETCLRQLPHLQGKETYWNLWLQKSTLFQYIEHFWLTYVFSGSDELLLESPFYSTLWLGHNTYMLCLLLPFIMLSLKNFFFCFPTWPRKISLPLEVLWRSGSHNDGRGRQVDAGRPHAKSSTRNCVCILFFFYYYHSVS